MNLISEIRKLFAETQRNKAREIECISNDFPTWVLRTNDWYGIGIAVPKDLEISEKFSDVRLWTNTMVIGGIEQPLLLLTSTIESLRYEFASICAQFADPGTDGSYRDEMMNNPLIWWERWRALLGNALQNKSAYSVLGELVTFQYLLENNLDPIWSGPDGGSHDLEMENGSFEVKSTINKYETVVTINGQFQLQSTNNELHLIFCRFESSELGVSINEVVENLVLIGADRGNLNRKLEKLGFEAGSSSRMEKYKLLEMRKYKIDHEFPAITSNSFKDNKIPDSVIQLTYKLDLSGINYESL
ncbi:hypothetical protein AB685_16945 [Bacillus sp. LL01]|uniref:PD-(D/E)XK motif protein n=1 Tax=Bacillus sp. LL01 TaxID=1665556 RepID=UPI00064CE411|nr:PD-(D/E)XK motif protein [Bacillus sp. LL01]KMJ57113.1 hypothetical protein AB685_16945 [Bacillus sp. LL01]